MIELTYNAAVSTSTRRMAHIVVTTPRSYQMISFPSTIEQTVEINLKECPYCDRLHQREKFCSDACRVYHCRKGLSA